MSRSPLGAITRLGIVLILAEVAVAQPNVIAGLDLNLADVGSQNLITREGVYPGGVNALMSSATICNPGTVVVPFLAAMNPDHPFIAFLMARESGGRFVQVSDRSFLKHTFGSANNCCYCGPCVNPGTGTLIGLGCDDTYGAGENSGHYWLGPADEIDPWLGTWNPACSHFDRGEPPVAPPNDCDGVRSLDSNQASALNSGVNHRVRVLDADLGVPGATFWYQVHYVVKAESEASRGNNLGSRQFVPTWTGSTWSRSSPGGLTLGPVLDRWTGATVASNTNGSADGRVYVAVRVTGPNQGLYHYEYAAYNRDNARAVSGFRVPKCAEARVLNAGFRDVDSTASNAWTNSSSPAQVVWSTTNNPLSWNSIYNFWFDSDAAPIPGSSATLDAFLTGPGSAQIGVATTAPLGLFNVHLGAGCGTPGAPTLYATGSPARATLGNATFGIEIAGNAPGATVLVFAGILDGTLVLGGGCSLYMTGPLGSAIFLVAYPSANSNGVVSLSTPVPVDPLLEGAHLNLQAFEIQPGSGAFLGVLDASNGLRVRIGDLLANCP